MNPLYNSYKIDLIFSPDHVCIMLHILLQNIVTIFAKYAIYDMHYTQKRFFRKNEMRFAFHELMFAFHLSVANVKRVM